MFKISAAPPLHGEVSKTCKKNNTMVDIHNGTKADNHNGTKALISSYGTKAHTTTYGTKADNESFT